MASSIPAPLVIEPSGDWIGIDGNWSSFLIRVGTPAQTFLTLPATGSNAIWIPLSEGCSDPPSSISDCAASRGVITSSGPESNGFATNASSTWDQKGLYELPLNQALFTQEQNGLYGLDSVGLGSALEGAQRLDIEDQTVVGISSVDLWTGMLGLGVRDSQVSDANVSSLLPWMKDGGLVPSLSYGYTAGASYRNSPGSLILGGFNESAFEPNDVVFNIDAGGHPRLNLESLVVVNSPIGTFSALPEYGVNLIIDSILPDLWLPQNVCDFLAQTLNLTFDSTTGRYLIDSSTHSALREASPEFTFTLSASQPPTETLNIVLPYSAFDLWLQPPIYESPVPYFPIRVTPDESDFILGRAFLQEAYIAIDWERGNFTLGQVVTGEGSPTITPILPVEDNASKGGSLGRGSIVGIVIGAVVAAACLLFAALWCRRRISGERRLADDSLSPRRMDEKTRSEESRLSELYGRGIAGHELDSKARMELLSTELTEMQGEEDKHQAMSVPLYELDGGYRAQELESYTGKKQTK